MTTNLEPAYVLDTHPLIWWLMGDRKLGANAYQIMEAAHRGETTLVLSAISIAEFYFWNRNHRQLDFARIMADLRSRPYFRLADFTDDDAISLEIDAHVPDIHDRIIAGLARRLRAPLLTRDPLITPVGDLRVLW